MARLEEMLEMVKKDQDVRQNLIEIKQKISDESLRRNFMYMLGGDFSVFTVLLRHEDPKVRRNAALILGMTDDEDVLPDLLEAWENENTLFVREEYLKAISMLDYREYLPRLRERITQLEEMLADSQAEAPEPDETSAGEVWDNDKHLLAELSRLRTMTDRYEKHYRHRFIRWDPAPDLLLMTNRLHADVTAGQIRTGTVNPMRGSVHVKGGNIKELAGIRTWTEMLFPIPGARPIAGDEKATAQRLRDLKIGNYLKYLHEESDQPFRYRIELKSVSIPKEKRGETIRRIASRLDALEKGLLLNTESGYEAEIRLIERKDKSFVPMLKLFTIPDRRFSYRKETTAQSSSAHLSALAMQLAKPYLKKGAQVLDPFCGSATLLIERAIALDAGSLYGVDRFGEAIEKARVNAGIAAETMEKASALNNLANRESPANYGHTGFYFINRDFFDFSHEYPFDEIVTHLPPSQDDESAFASAFLRKSSELLADHAVLTVITDAPRELEHAAADEDGFTVKDSFLLNEKAGTTELIMEYGST